MDNMTAKVSCFASGYDTFPLRNENVAVQVYELDLPDMLDDKKKRIDNWYGKY